MTKHVLGQVAEARLWLVDDILKAAGWAEKDGGWTPPEHLRAAINRTNGEGTWAREHAIAFQVQADQITAATQLAA